ncbi:hypothetical protein Tsubulata_026619 [Turnera subulata]|uniref:RRM domain-containing protein n=1 Tax=Turnera subulata TaxID=218843 RepID=A0A9Q0F1U3_9ROSI|nr:hypothetical protein Tsubulata_026619 [Turnera subulata]
MFSLPTIPCSPISSGLPSRPPQPPPPPPTTTSLHVHSTAALPFSIPSSSTTPTGLPIVPTSTQTNPHPPPSKPLQFSKWNRNTIQNAIDNNLVVSIYIESLPTRWLPTDLQLVMSRFGDVMDVFIPQKPNRQGKRYAFVRFNRKADVQGIFLRINSVQVDGSFLVAHLAKKCLSHTNSRFHPSSQNIQAQPPKAKAHNRSYVAAVQGPTSRSPSMLPAHVYIPKGSSPDWLNRCILGVLKNPIPLSSLTTLVASSLSKDVDVIPMGGVSYLIKFSSTEDIVDAINSKPEAINHLFSEFRPWKVGDFAFNRLCWVLFRGIPPHVWNEEFFKVIASKVGTMVDYSPETKPGTRLDVAEVLILTSNVGSIDRTLSVQVGGVQALIGIMETQYDPNVWSWSSSIVGSSSSGGGDSSDGTLPSVTPSHAKCTELPPSSGHSTAQLDKAVGSHSLDPFNLRPIIEKGLSATLPPSLSHLSRSSSFIPSELSDYIPYTESHMAYPSSNPLELSNLTAPAVSAQHSPSPHKSAQTLSLSSISRVSLNPILLMYYPFSAQTADSRL